MRKKGDFVTELKFQLHSIETQSLEDVYYGLDDALDQAILSESVTRGL